MPIHIAADPGTEDQIPLAKRLLERVKWRRSMGDVDVAQSVVNVDSGRRIVIRSIGENDFIYITGSVATFFGVYSVSVTIDGSEYDYAYVVAHDDNGNEVWRVALDAKSRSPSLHRGVIGCSSDGSRVLVAEADYTYVTVHEVVNGSISSSATMDVSSYSFTRIFLNLFSEMQVLFFGCRVSDDGRVACFRSAPTDGGGYPKKCLVFLYSASAEPKLTATEVVSDVIPTFDPFNPFVNICFNASGAKDLSTVYAAFGEHSGNYSSVPMIRATLGSGGAGWSVSSVDVADVAIGPSDIVRAGTFSVSATGAVAFGYGTGTDIAIVSGNYNMTVRKYVHMLGESFLLQENTLVWPASSTDPGTMLVGAAQVQVWCLSDDGATFAVLYRDDTASPVAYVRRLVRSGAIVSGFEPDNIHAVSRDGSAVLFQDNSSPNIGGLKVLLGATEYPVLFVEDGGEIEAVPLTGLPAQYAITNDGDFVYGHVAPHGYNAYGASSVLDENAFDTPIPKTFIYRWEKVVDGDGNVSYPTYTVVGDTPLTITVSPNETEVTAITSRLFNVYRHRAVL